MNCAFPSAVEVTRRLGSKLQEKNSFETGTLNQKSGVHVFHWDLSLSTVTLFYVSDSQHLRLPVFLLI